MAPNLAADARLLADVHALQSQCVGHADVGRDLGESVGVGEIGEDIVEIVHGVTDLVDAQFLGLT